MKQAAGKEEEAERKAAEADAPATSSYEHFINAQRAQMSPAKSRPHTAPTSNLEQQQTTHVPRIASCASPKLCTASPRLATPRSASPENRERLERALKHAKKLEQLRGRTSLASYTVAPMMRPDPNLTEEEEVATDYLDNTVSFSSPQQQSWQQVAEPATINGNSRMEAAAHDAAYAIKQIAASFREKHSPQKRKSVTPSKVRSPAKSISSSPAAPPPIPNDTVNDLRASMLGGSAARAQKPPVAARPPRTSETPRNKSPVPPARIRSPTPPRATSPGRQPQMSPRQMSPGRCRVPVAVPRVPASPPMLHRAAAGIPMSPSEFHARVRHPSPRGPMRMPPSPPVSPRLFM